MKQFPNSQPTPHIFDGLVAEMPSRPLTVSPSLTVLTRAHFRPFQCRDSLFASEESIPNQPTVHALVREKATAPPRNVCTLSCTTAPGAWPDTALSDAATAAVDDGPSTPMSTPGTSPATASKAPARLRTMTSAPWPP